MYFLDSSLTYLIYFAVKWSIRILVSRIFCEFNILQLFSNIILQMMNFSNWITKFLSAQLRARFEYTIFLISLFVISWYIKTLLQLSLGFFSERKEKFLRRNSSLFNYARALFTINSLIMPSIYASMNEILERSSLLSVRSRNDLRWEIRYTVAKRNDETGGRKREKKEKARSRRALFSGVQLIWIINAVCSFGDARPPGREEALPVPWRKRKA